jgi:uracil-DNA glycosylase family 4
MSRNRLAALLSEIVGCRRCARLTAYREQVAQERVRRFQDQTYWGKPVPSFGDPAARLLLVGLAPAAHGGNRTGRIFTGDRSGDFLFAALYRAGFSNQPASVHAGDGLVLRDAYVTASVRCAPPDNKPLPVEFAACRPYLIRELQSFDRLRVILALGAIAWTQVLFAWEGLGRPIPKKRPSFAHGAQAELSKAVTLLGAYHPSQRNTQTGLLTPAMFDAVLEMARRHLAH